MDNREQVIKENYLKAVTKTKAKLYFGFIPSDLYRTQYKRPLNSLSISGLLATRRGVEPLLPE